VSEHDAAAPGLAALHAELGGPPPDAFAQLDDAELADLAAALTEDRLRRARTLEAALEHALARVPRRARRSLKRRLLR
jgi:hypothetical protein